MKPATIDSGNAIPMLQTLGTQLIEIGDRRALMSDTVDDCHRNYFGAPMHRRRFGNFT